MPESTELKAGGTKQYVVGDKTLVLEPIPYGRLKKVLKIIFDAVQDVSSFKDANNEQLAHKVPELFVTHMGGLIPLLFDPKKHPFMTKEWLEDNMALPMVMDICESAIKINGMNDFFAKMRSVTARPTSAVQEVRPLVETQTT